MGLAVGQPGSAEAGVFNLPHFVNPGEFAVGLEPELVLTNGAGIGFNARYTHGMNDLMNGSVVLGTGSGPRRFRAGGILTLDFFPDLEGQPGIGVAASAFYYRLPNSGQTEVHAIPYIHKTFMSGKNEIEPFLSVPFGISFNEGRYQGLTQMAIGSMFKGNDNLRYSLEFGININNADSYVSGGVTYYH